MIHYIPVLLQHKLLNRDPVRFGSAYGLRLRLRVLGVRNSSSLVVLLVFSMFLIERLKVSGLKCFSCTLLHDFVYLNTQNR